MDFTVSHQTYVSDSWVVLPMIPRRCAHSARNGKAVLTSVDRTSSLLRTSAIPMVLSLSSVHKTHRSNALHATPIPSLPAFTIWSFQNPLNKKARFRCQPAAPSTLPTSTTPTTASSQHGQTSEFQRLHPMRIACVQRGVSYTKLAVRQNTACHAASLPQKS